MPAYRILLCALVLIFTACSGDDNGESDFAAVRVLHAATSVEEIDVEIDDVLIVSEARYGSESGYRAVNSGTQRVRIFDSGLSVPRADFRANFRKGDDHTLIPVSVRSRGETIVEPFLYPDEHDDPEIDNFALRIINASPDAGSFDVYISRERDPIEALTPVARGLRLGDASAYFERQAGEYVIRLTEAGTKDVFLNSGTEGFADGDVETVVVIDDRRAGNAPRLVFLNDN